MGYHEYKLLGAIVGPHFILAVLFTIDLTAIEYYATKEKIFWFCIIWFAPILGPIFFYRKKEEDDKKRKNKIQRSIKQKCKK